MQLNYYNANFIGTVQVDENHPYVYLACEASNTSANSAGRIQQIIGVASYNW